MSEDFLQLSGKCFAVFGVANKKSVAYFIARALEECGARVVYVVRDEQVRQNAARLLTDRPVIACNVESESDLEQLPQNIRQHTQCLDGLVHSIAYADYSSGVRPFHETGRRQFLQAVDVSCFSLLSLVNRLKDMLSRQAAIVTISISTTRMAADNYGYMAPIKAALDSSVVFLARSLGKNSDIRVNAVGAGLLKTSSSAGIPGYVDSYLFAEKVIPRGRNLETREVADTAVFLLSPRASGINGQTLIVDAGMACNFFDRDVVRATVSTQKKGSDAE